MDALKKKDAVDEIEKDKPLQKVSVYIPAYNVESTITAVIQGLLKQTYPIDEIILVDDGSTDRTLIMALYYPVRIARHQFNRGLAAARNTGIREAKNELVAFLDADVVPDEKWLERLMRYFSQESMVMVGGLLVETIDKTVADRWRNRHLEQSHGSELIKNPLFMFGNNGIVRKKAVEDVGWYSERFRTNGEDGDLSFRLKARGYKTLYDPKAICYHLREDNLRSLIVMLWKYKYPYHEEPFGLVANLKRFIPDYFKTFHTFYRSDHACKHWEFLPIDVLQFFGGLFLEFGYWFQVRVLRRSLP